MPDIPTALPISAGGVAYRQVEEARWVNIDVARQKLTFKNEKSIVDKAKEMILSQRLS
jgi:hypothetical protein